MAVTESAADQHADYLERVTAFALSELQPAIDSNAYKAVRLGVHDVLYTCLHAGRNLHLAHAKAFTTALSQAAAGSTLHARILPVYWGLVDSPAHSPHAGLFGMAAAMATLTAQHIPDDISRADILQAVADGVFTGMIGTDQRSFREAIEVLVPSLSRQPRLLPQYIALLARH